MRFLQVVTSSFLVQIVLHRWYDMMMMMMMVIVMIITMMIVIMMLMTLWWHLTHLLVFQQKSTFAREIASVITLFYGEVPRIDVTYAEEEPTEMLPKIGTTRLNWFYWRETQPTNSTIAEKFYLKKSPSLAILEGVHKRPVFKKAKL